MSAYRAAKGGTFDGLVHNLEGDSDDEEEERISDSDDEAGDGVEGEEGSGEGSDEGSDEGSGEGSGEGSEDAAEESSEEEDEEDGDGEPLSESDAAARKAARKAERLWEKRNFVIKEKETQNSQNKTARTKHFSHTSDASHQILIDSTSSHETPCLAPHTPVSLSEPSLSAETLTQ